MIRRARLGLIGMVSVVLAMDAVPEGVDQDAVCAYLGALPGIAEVHDLHIWG